MTPIEDAISKLRMVIRPDNIERVKLYNLLAYFENNLLAVEAEKSMAMVSEAWDAAVKRTNYDRLAFKKRFIGEIPPDKETYIKNIKL